MRHLLYCLFLWFSSTVFAQQEHVQAQWVDPSIKSCVDFDKLSERYEAAYRVVTEHYETIPGQQHPVAVLKGIENPQKLDAFMDWYGGGGNEAYFLLGNQCEIEVQQKYGSGSEVKIGLEIEREKNLIADFFVDHIVKRYNSLVKDYNVLLTTTQTYVESSQAYISSLERNNSQSQATRPIFIFPQPQSLNCTGNTTGFSTSTPYPGSVDTVTNANTTIRCR